MNPDAHHPDLSTLIAPELEARVVAWVSGEASAFETAELTRLTAEKPELAIFKRRIEAVRGLVAEAIRPDQAPLRLSPDRRTKLLQALGAPENYAEPAKPAPLVMEPLVAAKKAQRKDRRWIFALAACLTLGIFFSATSIPSFQRKPRPPLLLNLAEGTDENSDEHAMFNKEPAAEMKAKVRMHQMQVSDAMAASDATMRSKLKREEENTMRYPARREPATKSAVERQRIGAANAPGALAKASRPAASPSPALGGTAVVWDSFNQPIPRDLIAGTLARQSTIARYEATDAAGGKNEGEAPYYYAAQAPVAASRRRTDLKDVGSSVTVVTKEFLKDTGATNARDLLAYTAGTEVGGARGNFAAPDLIAPSVSRGYGDAIPIRGLEAPAAVSGSADDEKLVLSPFMVEAKKNGGYKAENTLAGFHAGPADAETDGDKSIAQPRKSLQQPDTVFAEISASVEPVSTFSLHVSDVSFRLAQAALAKDEEMDRASIRPEEFYNAFSYGDTTPAMAEKVSCRIEQSAHPFAQQRNLVRIAVKVASAGRDAAQPLRLTVLLDTSGSMEREDRAATVHGAMSALVSLLGPNDRLTLIGFARQPRLLAESLPGDQAAQVLNLIKNTPAEGGTNLEEALALGRQLAQRQFDAGAQNRIVLLTDGAANLGNADPAQLAATIETLRQQGIAFDACGVGLEGLDDGMLENLTRKGDGRYYVLNSPEAADAGFAKQLAGAFRPAAENVKLQVRFNPARVGRYRLIGFEQHRLREEDFRNDQVDAAELAAEEAAVAVYQVETLPQGEGELGEVYVRFRDAATGNMVERSWTLNHDAHAPAFDRATPTMQLAGTAALLAEKLRGGEAGDAINLGDLAPVVHKLRSHYANEPRVQELVTMFEQARKLAGE